MKITVLVAVSVSLLGLGGCMPTYYGEGPVYDSPIYGGGVYEEYGYSRPYYENRVYGGWRDNYHERTHLNRDRNFENRGDRLRRAQGVEVERQLQNVGRASGPVGHVGGNRTP